MPNVYFKFDNYRIENNKFKADVLFLSGTPNEKLFGMNVRFFYDGSQFELASSSTVQFVDFAPGYGPFNPNPPAFGNSTAGIAFFKLSTKSAPYINGAIQLNDLEAAPTLSTDPTNWTRLFTVQLVPKTTESFYPILIWDKRSPANLGGFTGTGSAGVVIVNVLSEENGEIRTKPADEIPTHSNWVPYSTATKAPWGEPSPIKHI